MKTLKINGSESETDIGKIVCLGRNYREHIKEMEAELPGDPVIFLKPASSLIRNGEPILYPSFSNNMHHEVELVVVIGKNGKNILPDQADQHILGYAVGLDMTLRDIQSKAKIQGLPWTIAKGFDSSAPVSEIILAEKIRNPKDLTISCTVNGVLRQKSSTKLMILQVNQIIAYVSTIFTLESGDLIFTGTPEGVGPVHPGDLIEAEIIGLIKTSHPVVAG